MKLLNDSIKYLADRLCVNVQLRPIPFSEMLGYVYVGAAKDNAEGGTSHTTYLLGATEKKVSAGEEAVASTLSWSSRASPRRCSASLIGEAYALTFDLAGAEWAFLSLHLACDGKFQARDREKRRH